MFSPRRSSILSCDALGVGKFVLCVNASVPRGQSNVSGTNLTQRGVATKQL